jgi:RNA polymerase sigma factor (sigma-70 family)
MGGERELVSRCVRGDRRAWAELVERHDRRLLLVLLRASPGASAAELTDLRQDVWTKLVERGALADLRLEHAGSLFAFLARVALRVAIDHGRARKVRPAEDPEEAAYEVAGGSDPEAETERAELHQRLSRALVRVAEGPNAQRDLLVLRAHLHDGLNPGEISAMGVGLSPKGVETFLRRARERLVNEMSR